MTPRDVLAFDGVLILGAGLAGLSAALAAAPRKALVISPTALGEGAATGWAQGGMAVALSDDDSPALHAADTVAAGAGLVDETAALDLTTAGPQAVRDLADLGAPFDRDAGGRFLQSLEAAHGRARVARVGGDGAGKAILDAVAAQAVAAPTIEIWTHARARALLQDATGRVRGALIERDGKLVEVVAPATILATGGLGGLYAVTTDPRRRSGRGPGARGPGRRPHRRRRVRAVPPHRPRPRARPGAARHRGAARGGGRAGRRQGRAVHAALRRPRRTGPARRGGPRHPRRAQCRAARVPRRDEGDRRALPA